MKFEYLCVFAVHFVSKKQMLATIYLPQKSTKRSKVQKYRQTTNFDCLLIRSALKISNSYFIPYNNNDFIKP